MLGLRLRHKDDRLISCIINSKITSTKSRTTWTLFQLSSFNLQKQAWYLQNSKLHIKSRPNIMDSTIFILFHHFNKMKQYEKESIMNHQSIIQTWANIFHLVKQTSRMRSYIPNPTVWKFGTKLDASIQLLLLSFFFLILLLPVLLLSKWNNLFKWWTWRLYVW